MRKRFPIYTRLLGLYPRSYRQEYGPQLEQTLADMLDDEPSRFGRLYIWSQVTLDFPVTVIQQNLTAIRGHQMQKYVPKMNKKSFVILLAVLLVLMGAGAYQFGRSKVVPAIAKLMYGNSMRSWYEENRQALGDPSKALIGNSKDASTMCGSIYEGIRVHVDCSVAMQSYGLLPQGEEGKKRAVEAANNLENNLKKTGYGQGIDGNTNGVTVSGLVSGTYQGIDYSPDAFYSKKTGDTLCTFQVTVAYSNPKPPAINIVHACNRQFDPFGIPPMIEATRDATGATSLPGIVFDSDGAFTEEEKKIIRERIIDPKIYYEQNILKQTDSRTIEISKGNPGYVLQSTYAKEEAKLGFVFGASGTIEFWVPELCDDGGCQDYPDNFKNAFPQTYAAFTTCKTKSKVFETTANCVSG